MAYSEDQDLRKYLSDGDYALLPLPLTALHDEAGRQLDAILKASPHGLTDADLLILTTATTDALREVSALNVLAMFFGRFGDTAERSESFAKRYRDQIKALPVETTDDEDGEPAVAGGYVVLG